MDAAQCSRASLHLKMKQLSSLQSLTCSSSPSPRKPHRAQVTDKKPESQPHKSIGDMTSESHVRQVIAPNSNTVPKPWSQIIIERLKHSTTDQQGDGIVASESHTESKSQLYFTIQTLSKKHRLKQIPSHSLSSFYIAHYYFRKLYRAPVSLRSHTESDFQHHHQAELKVKLSPVS